MIGKVTLCSAIMAFLVAVSGVTAAAMEPMGPFDIRIVMPQLPNIGEEAAVICSVTSSKDADSTAMLFWCPDTANAKMTKGQTVQYNCKFKKGETKEFAYTMAFQNQGFFHLIASCYRFFPGGTDANYADLYLQIHRDGKAEILEHMPVRSQDPSLRGARLDSLKSKAKRAKRLKGTDD